MRLACGCLEGTRDGCQADSEEVSVEDFRSDEFEACQCSCHDDHDGEDY